MLFWLGLNLFEILKPADNMFRIDIFEALFNKTADISLKVMISLKFVNLNDDKSPFKCSKGSEVFDLPSVIAKRQELLLETKNILMRGWKNDEMTGDWVLSFGLRMSCIHCHGVPSLLHGCARPVLASRHIMSLSLVRAVAVKCRSFGLAGHGYGEYL
jgi:hypothetical protein